MRNLETGLHIVGISPLQPESSKAYCENFKQYAVSVFEEENNKDVLVLVAGLLQRLSLQAEGKDSKEAFRKSYELDKSWIYETVKKLLVIKKNEDIEIFIEENEVKGKQISSSVKNQKYIPDAILHVKVTKKISDSESKTKTFFINFVSWYKFLFQEQFINEIKSIIRNDLEKSNITIFNEKYYNIDFLTHRYFIDFLVREIPSLKLKVDAATSGVNNYLLDKVKNENNKSIQNYDLLVATEFSREYILEEMAVILLLPHVHYPFKNSQVARNVQEGLKIISEWVDDEKNNSLIEKFLLEFFESHLIAFNKQFLLILKTEQQNNEQNFASALSKIIEEWEKIESNLQAEISELPSQMMKKLADKNSNNCESSLGLSFIRKLKKAQNVLEVKYLEFCKEIFEGFKKEFPEIAESFEKYKKGYSKEFTLYDLGRIKDFSAIDEVTAKKKIQPKVKSISKKQEVTGNSVVTIWHYKDFNKEMTDEIFDELDGIILGKFSDKQKSAYKMEVNDFIKDWNMLEKEFKTRCDQRNLGDLAYPEKKNKRSNLKEDFYDVFKGLIDFLHKYKIPANQQDIWDFEKGCMEIFKIRLEECEKACKSRQSHVFLEDKELDEEELNKRIVEIRKEASEVINSLSTKNNKINKNQSNSVRPSEAPSFQKENKKLDATKELKPKDKKSKTKSLVKALTQSFFGSDKIAENKKVETFKELMNDIAGKKMSDIADKDIMDDIAKLSKP